MSTGNVNGVNVHLNGASLNRVIGRNAVASKLRRDIAAVQQVNGNPRELGNSSMGTADTAGSLKKACVDFEAVLMNMMFQAMRKTVPRDGIFEDSLQHDIFNSMYYQKLAQGGAEGEGLGLASVLYEQLSTDAAV